MLGNVGIYAAKKRKKPVQKLPKPPPSEGGKSNPSKRHRDRLNSELDKLTSLLPFPEDVCARLDKLSVLRLSVGYLKVKNFFNVTMQKGSGTWPAVFSGNGKNTTTMDNVNFTEGDLLLQSLNGFVLVVTAEGYVFYSSSTIQDYLGFHQSDVVHQSVFELIHTDDRAMFRRQLHFALKPNYDEQEEDDCEITTSVVTYDPQHIPPENSSFLERNFVCRFRCLLDNSSGFLALSFQGRLKYLHGQNKVTEDGTVVGPQLALFAIGTPVQPPSVMEIRTKTLIFQTKHKLDFTPLGIDTRGKVILGYTEMELCLRGSGYQFIHAADMMHCADKHVQMIKKGESGFTVFRLLTKTGTWLWVQANARLVYKVGRPDFIIVRQKALTNEEGEEHLRQRKMMLPFHYATGEGVLYDTTPTLDLPLMSGNGRTNKIRKMPDQKAVDPDSILGFMLKQDQSIYIQSPDTDSQFSLEKAFMDSHALLNVPGDTGPEGPPLPHGAVKEEFAIRTMIDSLEQIIGDRDFCSTLEELDPAELKDWENTLFRMNVKDSDLSMELHDILTNDIFAYVEEALSKENVLNPPADGFEQLGATGTTPAPPGDFPSNSLGNQGFDHCNPILGDRVVTDPRANFLGAGGQSLLGTGSEVRGMQKLTHLGPRIQSVLQQIRPSDAFARPLGLPGLCPQNGPLTFDPASAGSCAQASAQVRRGLPGVHSPMVNGLGPYLQSNILPSPHGAPGQAHPDPMAPPLQNQTHPGISVQPMAFQQQNSMGQSNQISVSQENQWVPSIPDADFADNLLEACTLSASVQPDLDPPLPVCLQGQFSLQTQDSASPGLLSWQWQQQHPLPTATQNGHQPPPGCFSPAQGFQWSPPAGFPHQGAQNCRVCYAPRKTPSSIYQPNPEGALLANPPPTKVSSCMFERGDPSANLNGVRFSNAGPLAGPACSCPTQIPPFSQSPLQASCYFQRKSSEPVMASLTIAPSDTSCQAAHTFTPESLLGPTQYLTCSGQTQIPGRPQEESAPCFPPISSETTCFSESNQTNCCDF